MAPEVHTLSLSLCLSRSFGVFCDAHTLFGMLALSHALVIGKLERYKNWISCQKLANPVFSPGLQFAVNVLRCTFELNCWPTNYHHLAMDSAH
uniref:Putative secreted protein n=1 Tax=Anopheles darlingi TaxID=43151 RepID=A0A2M4DEH7_ANODA